jgi:hypothetical protein
MLSELVAMGNLFDGWCRRKCEVCMDVGAKMATGSAAVVGEDAGPDVRCDHPVGNDLALTWNSVTNRVYGVDSSGCVNPRVWGAFSNGHPAPAPPRP